MLGSHNFLASSDYSKQERELGLYTTDPRIIAELIKRFEDAEDLEQQVWKVIAQAVVFENISGIDPQTGVGLQEKYYSTTSAVCKKWLLDVLRNDIQATYVISILHYA